MNSCKTRNKRSPEKAHAAGKRTGGVGFLRIWLFCQNHPKFPQPAGQSRSDSLILRYPELFKLFLSKGFGDGGGHLAFIVQNIFLLNCKNASSRLTQ